MQCYQSYKTLDFRVVPGFGNYPASWNSYTWHVFAHNHLSHCKKRPKKRVNSLSKRMDAQKWQLIGVLLLSTLESMHISLYIGKDWALQNSKIKTKTMELTFASVQEDNCFVRLLEGKKLVTTNSAFMLELILSTRLKAGWPSVLMDHLSLRMQFAKTATKSDTSQYKFW